jgi:phenylalanine-4-hydroxylase
LFSGIPYSEFVEVEPGIARCADPTVPGGYCYRIEGRVLRELGEPGADDQPSGLQKYPDLVDDKSILQPFVEIIYSPEEHDRWRRMFADIERTAPGRTVSDVMKGFDWIRRLGGMKKIPSLQAMSDDMETISGFKLVPALGLVSNDSFFRMLMEGEFPITLSLRREEEYAYTPFPDIFHDLVGHAPMFLNKDFCEFVRKIGELGLSFAGQPKPQSMVSKIYWYTIEFGLKGERYRSLGERIAYRDLQVYGAGIASSVAETQISVEAEITTGDRKINRLPFDLERLLLSHYDYDNPQELYFVIDSYHQLAELFAMDLGAFIQNILAQVKRGEKTMIPQGVLRPGEEALVIPPNPPVRA